MSTDTDLDQRVRAMLEANRGHLNRVAKASGVSYSWISKFLCGHVPRPGYIQLRKLERYLEQLERHSEDKPH